MLGVLVDARRSRRDVTSGAAVGAARRWKPAGAGRGRPGAARRRRWGVGPVVRRNDRAQSCLGSRDSAGPRGGESHASPGRLDVRWRSGASAEVQAAMAARR
jgi:hypothetical protein